MKTCCNCKQEKSLEEFDFQNKTTGKRQARCKECRKLYNKQHYRDNKVDYIAKATVNNRRYYDERREFLDELKADLKCELCGEDHPGVLDFHHPDPSKKDRAVSAMLKACSIARIKKEINKCSVWCSNCHRKHHWEERQHARVRQLVERSVSKTED